jgi:glycosyl transferase family 25
MDVRQMNVKVFLINLARSTDRLEHSKSQLDALGIEFERLEAVDGLKLTSSQVSQHYDIDANSKLYKKTLSVGEVACYLSHRVAWKRIIDEKLDYAIILEDDSIVEANFNALYSALNKLKDWDYIRIANFSEKYQVDERIKIDNHHDLVHFDQIPINTGAQAVSLKGAKQLYKTTERFSRPVDVDIKHYWEKGIDLVGITPHYISLNDKFESNISAISNNKGREETSNLVRRVRYIVNFKVKNYLNKKERPKLSEYII